VRKGRLRPPFFVDALMRGCVDALQVSPAATIFDLALRAPFLFPLSSSLVSILSVNFP
jgi:hypothetical protein